MPDTPRPGIGVDVKGNPVVDPTQNVRELVDAAIKRQDDLRIGDRILTKSEIEGLRAEIMSRLDCFKDLLETAERLRLEQKGDTRTSVEAAFKAAQALVSQQADAAATAINKSETASATQAKNFEITLNDLKTRLSIIETQSRTQKDTREDSRGSIAMYVGVASGIFGFIMVVIAIITTVVVMNQ